ncbi:MAG: PilZ domain [Deltaproteobacteria bacterium]|nr:PilZ domain [Deltaproteobacteria bacterium]
MCQGIYPIDERRQTNRILVTTLGSVFGERAVAAGIVRDLSPRGLQVMTEVNVHPGDLVEIKVELPDGHGAILAQARVVWCRSSENSLHPHLAGLEFVQIRPEDLGRLQAFVAPLEGLT